MTRSSLVALAIFALFAAGASQAAQTKTKTLFGTVGPGFAIKLKTSSGATVKTATAGTYNFVITDKSSMHNFHLSGPGVNKATGVAFKGTKTWKNVTVGKGKTYKYRCDVHPTTMKGSFKGK